MAGAGGVLLALAGLALVLRRPVHPVLPQQVAKAPEVPAMTARRDQSRPSPLAIPSMCLVSASMPGPGAQGHFEADLPSLSIPRAVAQNGPGPAIGLRIPSVSFPRF